MRKRGASLNIDLSIPDFWGKLVLVGFPWGLPGLPAVLFLSQPEKHRGQGLVLALTLAYARPVIIRQ